MRGKQYEWSDDVATVKKQSEPLVSGLAQKFLLHVIAGPDVGRSFVLDEQMPGRTLLGQSSACAVRLKDPLVSRRHAAIELVGTKLRVRDLQSSNGTYVNELSIVEAHLSGGEVIRVGETTLRLESTAASLAPPPPYVTSFGRVVGVSPEMQRLYPLFQRVAASNVPLVIEGETGTGKEVLAEALHEASPRATGPFTIFDCTSVPGTLVESALFGHERGAFTGAVAAKRGAFESAHGGTLFIDEIGDLDIGLQPKLLRAIERSEVQRVGSDRWLKVDVRIIAATRRDLDREIAAGRFRDDLFYRLAVARVELPPLQRRHGDISHLARHFWRELGRTDDPPPELLQRFEDYHWPGNVRELHNAVARYIALGDFSAQGAFGPPGVPEHDERFIGDILTEDLPLTLARQKVIEEFERRYVARVLARHDGNVSRAAAASGLARRYFQLLRSRRTR